MSQVAGEEQDERIIELNHNCVLNEWARMKKPSRQVKSEILRKTDYLLLLQDIEHAIIYVVYNYYCDTFIKKCLEGRDKTYRKCE